MPTILPMLIRKPDQVQAQPMTMPGAKGVTMRLMVGRTDGAPNFAMRQFHVEAGGHTPLHQHNYEHQVLILSGHGQLAHGPADGDAQAVEAGDVVYIAANDLHQFRNDTGEPLRFMCLVPTQFDCGGQCQPTPGS